MSHTFKYSHTPSDASQLASLSTYPSFQILSILLSVLSLSTTYTQSFFGRLALISRLDDPTPTHFIHFSSLVHHPPSTGTHTVFSPSNNIRHRDLNITPQLFGFSFPYPLIPLYYSFLFCSSPSLSDPSLHRPFNNSPHPAFFSHLSHTCATISFPQLHIWHLK